MINLKRDNLLNRDGCMNNHRSFWLAGMLVACMVFGISTRTARAAGEPRLRAIRPIMSSAEANQAPLPTQAETPESTAMPEVRVLPPVGGNAGLVLGASVLVLTILGGVILFSRRKPRH
jgi:hypothetical protein